MKRDWKFKESLERGKQEKAVTWFLISLFPSMAHSSHGDSVSSSLEEKSFTHI